MQPSTWKQKMRRVTGYWMLFSTMIFSLCVTAQTIPIPDPHFKAFLVAHYDTNGDGEIQLSEARAVTGTMDTPGEILSHGHITNLTGIEYFTGLTGLDCSYEQLTTLDVHANTALQTLDCSGNPLTTLDVSANKALKVLWCDNNRIMALDVSANKALQALECNGNQLTFLDVHTNKALQTLACARNRLTALDVSANTALRYLDCSGNRLTALDVSANKALTVLHCGGNRLAALDVHANTALTTLDCGSNQLTALDVSANTALQDLECTNNRLTALDVRANTALQILDCAHNQLTKLDVHAHKALRNLQCGHNRLTDIPDVTGCTDLYVFQCPGNDFDDDDCTAIIAVKEMGLSTFAYNPQADGSTLDCFGDTTITRSAAGGGRILPGRREETQVSEDPIALSLPPRPAWRLGVDLTEVPGLSKVPPDVRKRLLVPVPLKGLRITDTKKRAWANWLARRLEATVKDIGTLSIAGRVSPELSYAVFALCGDDKGWELALIRENDGALIYRRELSMYIPDEHDWIDPTRVGAFSFDISKEKALYGLVIAGATGIPYKYGISGTGGWMVLVVSGNRLASAKTLGETCDADIHIYDDTNSLSSSRAYVVDADGDGYRDLLLWKRMYASTGSSGNGENSKGCMSLKSEAVQLARFNPDTLDFELQSSAPAKYALRDDLWYPAAWGYARGQDDIEKPWAGCDDSDPGFEWSEFFTYLCPKDRARYPNDKSFVPSKQTGKNTEKTGK